MPSYGSGLSAQFGVGPEGTVGTPATITRFYEFLEEELTFEPTWLESEGLKSGQAYKRTARTLQSRYTVNGEITMEHVDRGGMGLLWKHALGSSISAPTQIGTTGAYVQVHTEGSKYNLGLTAQLGRPETDTTVVPFTYFGMKVVEWEFAVSDGELAMLTLTFDGWGESTAVALATASYVAAATPFSFADASVFKLGGVATTTAGVTTISGGTTVATVVRELTVTGETPMAVERYGLGNAGQKLQQIENDFPTITGEMEAEFTDLAEIYSKFKANTPVPLQIDFTHGTAGTGEAFRLSFIMPSVRLKVANVNVDGPDIVPQEVEFEAYDDGSNPVIQVRIVSVDTTL